MMKKILLFILALLPVVSVMADDWTQEVKMRGVPATDDNTYYYATYYNGTRHFIMPAGVSAYSLFFNTDKDWQMDHIYDSNGVRKEEPVLLVANSTDIAGKGYTITDGVLTINLTAVTNTETIASLDKVKTYKEQGSNDLCGSDDAVDLTQDTDKGDYYYYALQMHHKDGDSNCKDASGKQNTTCPHIGFFWMEADGAPFTSGAHKAYLRVEKSVFKSSARSQGFDFSEAIISGSTTGITEVSGSKVSSSQSSIYDLQGRTINAAPQKGIYIKDGQKYIAR